MATKKSSLSKAPKVGTYRGGSKTSASGRGGFMGKTTSGGNLGRAAMANASAISAAKGYGRSGGENAAAFGVGGGASIVGGGSAGGSAAYGGAPGMGNASGAGMDYSASGLIESILNPGGAPYTPAGGYQSGGQGDTGGGWQDDFSDYGGVTYQSPAPDVPSAPDMPEMPPDVGPGADPVISLPAIRVATPTAPAPAPAAPVAAPKPTNTTTTAPKPPTTTAPKPPTTTAIPSTQVPSSTTRTIIEPVGNQVPTAAPRTPAPAPPPSSLVPKNKPIAW